MKIKIQIKKIKYRSKKEMKKMKVVVVDGDARVCEMAKRGLESEEMEVVGTANNGVECLELLKNNEVDVVLTELMLPAMDGYMLIDKINNSARGNKPKVFVMTSISSETLLTAAFEKNIIYYFIKPLDFAVIKKVIMEKYNSNPLWQILNKKDKQVVKTEEVMTKQKVQVLDERISKIFIMIGIPAHIKGYQYLRHAIKQVMADSMLINNITKKLYPNVAEAFDSSASKVERAIRHAIDVAWSRGKIENINKVFGFKVYSANDKPTNGEFIALVADKLMHDMSEEK